MKKRILAAVLCLTMAVAMLAGCGSSDSGSSSSSAASIAKDNVTFDVDPEYDPNSSYDVYTVFEYTIESAGATFPVTLSASNALDKFEIHCNFYGDEQLVTVTKSGDEYTVTSDKTGFMSTDAPLICRAGIDSDNWAAIK